MTMSPTTDEKCHISTHVTRCPACGGTENPQIGRKAPAFDSVASGEKYRQSAYTVFCCTGCGLYFKSHTMSADSLDDYYGRLECETFEHDGNFPTDRLLRQTLDRLAIGSSVLDFGCSTRPSLKGLAGRLRCVGVEINQAAANIASQRGIRIVPEHELRARTHGDFDAILLTDVYEHLSRPVELVEMLAGLLKPGGWLAIVTGNADTIRTRERIGEFWYFRIPGHLQMLSERHVNWLAERLGLSVEALHRCSHYDTPARERVRQWIQTFVYYQFRHAPTAGLTALLRVVPFLKQAERWPSAPALTYTSDHVVAVFQKSLAGPT